MVSSSIKDGLKTAIQFLNQPAIKEGVKNITGTVTFTFGIFEAYDIYQILRGREICTETNLHASKWIQIATKTVLVSEKISLILSAATSRPGVFIISTFMGSIFSSRQLERACGPNTIFAINPWHPRHIFSIAGVILALPALLQSTCQEIGSWQTDTKVRMMTLLNTITSRPVQHLGNQLCRAWITV